MNLEEILLNASKKGIIFNITTSTKDAFNITVIDTPHRIGGWGFPRIQINNLLSEDTT